MVDPLNTSPQTTLCCFLTASLCRASITADSRVRSGFIWSFSDNLLSLIPTKIRSLTSSSWRIPYSQCSASRYKSVMNSSTVSLSCLRRLNFALSCVEFLSLGLVSPCQSASTWQDLGLQFEGDQWTAKQSNTGLSISFFWPVHDRSTFDRSVKRTPIAPSPIAFRTRGRIKNSHNVT